MSTQPTVVIGFPMSATSRPRFTLRLSDSCGESIEVVVRVSVCFGCAGSDMSSTATPCDPAPGLNAFSGNISVWS